MQVVHDIDEVDPGGIAPVQQRGALHYSLEGDVFIDRGHPVMRRQSTAQHEGGIDDALDIDSGVRDRQDRLESAALHGLPEEEHRGGDHQPVVAAHSAAASAHQHPTVRIEIQSLDRRVQVNDAPTLPDRLGDGVDDALVAAADIALALLAPALLTIEPGPEPQRWHFVVTVAELRLQHGLPEGLKSAFA